MNIKAEDLMIASVITTHRHQTIGHAKDIMKRNNVHSLPIVDSENILEGIITVNDLTDEISDDTKVGHIMVKKVLTIPKYSGIHVAARIMRNHHIHHLVVTHEKKIVGVLSSFDLLALVEEHRYISKNPPTKSKNKHQRI
ncbi:MAG: CBS domain-containing protein [Bacteroidetes bacterium]|jgi:CBS domain-containing protein|nr:CBS domain-containing protein [Bacteroidota bacterium]MDF1868010.1 CBS domain-containing protein [Saprospiraceae bacterium]